MDNKSNVSEEVSPTVSRFGRTRKPKISSDFCDIDEIFNDQKREAKSPPKVIKPVKQASLLKPVQKLQVTGSKNLVIPKDLNIYMNAPKQIIPLNTEQAPNQMKLIKISGDSIKNRKFFKTKPTVTTELEDDIDVSKVMKLVVGKSGEQPSRIQKPISDYRKTLIKTYGNKRRDFNRPRLESFGLPDEPIIPLIESNITKPKSIQSLDVDKPSRDVTLIDSKDKSQWKAMNSKGPSSKVYCMEKVAKTSTKPIHEAKIAQRIDENLRTKKFNLRNVINVNFNTLQKNIHPVHDDDYEEVIELDDEDEFRALNPIQASTPLQKNKIIIHSNELITPAKKLLPKVKILEDIVFKNSSDNSSGKSKFQMSSEVETDSSEQQIFNLEYTNETPVEDLVGGNMIEGMIFDSSKDNILETDSVPIDSDSICSSMSVENIILPNENTIITFSSDFAGEETVGPVIDEESYSQEAFDGNEETVFTTMDSDVLCAAEQESPVLILINKDGENIIIESNLDEVEGVDIEQTSESKEDEGTTFEGGDFNLQIDLGNQGADQDIKISEEDNMIVLDENMVSRLGDSYIILRGDLDTKDNPADDDMEGGTQYILQCTGSEELEELVIDTTAVEPEISTEEILLEEASTSHQETNDTKKDSSEGSNNKSIVTPKRRGSSIIELMKSPEDNLPINRKSYKAIREKIKLEARNLLRAKTAMEKKSVVKQNTTTSKSKSQLLRQNKNVGERMEAHKEPDSKASPKRNKSRKQQENVTTEISRSPHDTTTETSLKSSQTSVKSQEESIQLETPRKKKGLSTSCTEYIKTSNTQNEKEKLELPIKKKTIEKDESSTSEKTRKSKIVGEENNQSDKMKQPNVISKRLTTPDRKKLTREHQKPIEENRTPGKTKTVGVYKRSMEESKLLHDQDEAEKVGRKINKMEKVESKRTKIAVDGASKSIQEIIKSPKQDELEKPRTPKGTEKMELRRAKEEITKLPEQVESKELPKKKSNEKEKLESKTINKTPIEESEEVTKSNKKGEAEKLETPSKKKESKSSLRENETAKKQSNTEKPEQNKKKTDKSAKEHIVNLKDANETEESEGKLETPSKRKTSEKHKKSNEPENALKPQNKGKNKSAVLQEDSGKDDQSIKLKSLDENTSMKITTEASSTLNALEGEISTEKLSVKPRDGKFKPRDQSPGMRKSLRSLLQEGVEIKIDQPKALVKLAEESSTLNALEGEISTEKLSLKPRDGKLKPRDQSPGMRKSLRSQLQEGVEIKVDQPKALVKLTEESSTLNALEGEISTEKLSFTPRDGKLKPRDQSPGMRKSLRSQLQEGIEIKVDQPKALVKLTDQKLMDKVKSKDISLEPLEDKDKGHQPEKTSRGKSHRNEKRAISLDGNKSSPKDNVISQNENISNDMEIEENRKSSRLSHSKDQETSSQKEVILEEKALSVAQCSREFIDQETKVVTSQIGTTENLSDKDKTQQVTSDSLVDAKEQNLASTVATLEASTSKSKKQDEKKTTNLMGIKDKISSEKRSSRFSQQEKEVGPETLSEKDKKPQVGSEKNKESKEGASLERRKSSRFSNSKEQELKLATPGASTDRKKSLRISLPLQQEQQNDSQTILSEDSSDKEITCEKSVEKRKSSRISQPREENQPVIKEHKQLKVEDGDDSANQKEEKGKSLFKEPEQESQHEIPPEKRKLRGAKQQDQIPSTSSKEEALPCSQVSQVNKYQEPHKIANIKEIQVIVHDFASIKHQKQDLTTATEKADKRKSTRLSQINSQTQDQHLTPQTAHSVSPDKKKSTRSVKDAESIDRENVNEPEIDVSTDIRKTRSGKDFELMKQESLLEFRKTRSVKDVERVKAEDGSKTKSKDAECVKLVDIPGDERKTRSVKDVEGLKQESVEVLIEYRPRMLKELDGIDLDNILPAIPGVSRITRSVKELEGMKQENVQEGVFNDSKKIASGKDTAGTKLFENSGDKTKDAEGENSQADRRKSLRLFSPKTLDETQIDQQKVTLTSEEPVERRKSSRISSTNTVDEKLGVKRLLVEDPNTTKTLKESEDVLMEEQRLEVVESKEPKSNVDGNSSSPKKKAMSVKEHNADEPGKQKTNKAIEGLTTTSDGKKKCKLVKEPKIVVRLKNIHNSWTNTNLMDNIKPKLDKQKVRALRSNISDDTSPTKEIPQQFEGFKKRKSEHGEHKQKKQQKNKSKEKRRSARVSELSPVSYKEQTKACPEKIVATCSNSLKDIMDDVEYIKRAMQNSLQDNVNDDEKTVDDDVTKVTIKEEVVEDEVKPVLLQEDEIKKEIKEEPLDDFNQESPLKQEHNFMDGDLTYAKLGHFPYWPCLITQEPDTKLIKTLKINNTLMYHVRFFGDKGRRSWVREKHLIPLKSKDDLHSMYTRLKKQGAPSIILNSYKPNPKIHRMWEVGLNEALTMLDKTVEERYEFFFNMFASEQEKLQKTLTNSPIYRKPDEIKIKSEKLDEVLENSASKPKKPKYLKSPVKKVKSREIDNNSEVELTRRKRGRPLKKEPEEDDDVIEVLKTGASTPELKKTHLSIIDLSSECSLSDTDSSSRWSIRTPIVCTSENQAALYKRNSLFKGVQRDKVCQRCLKPGEVFKCRGKCFGYYHKECSMYKVKVNVEDEEEDSDCQIVLVKDKKYDSAKKLTLNTDKNFREMTLAEQIDFKLKEIMAPMISKNIYADSTSDYTSSEDSSSEKCTELTVEHVTADDVILVNKASKKKKLSKSEEDFKCSKCASNMDPECFACGYDRSPRNTSTYRQKCSIIACGKFFHPECLKVWPQTQISLHSTSKYKESGVQFDSFSCPMHMCHMCISDDPRASISRLSSVKIVRCLKCPATYHSNTCCVPAGTEIVSSTQIVCPRHLLNVKGKSVKRDIINTKWCFICSEGGDLICCETCPTSVHAECSQLTIKDDDTFVCEECETGRLPLYDEIVWVKLGKYRWWPALILFPNEIPENIKNMQHQHGEFVVKFFGTHDHYWVHRGRVFLFQEGDEGPGGNKKRMDQVFKKAVEEAAEAHAFKTEFKKNMEESMKVCDKPPPYIRIKVNKPVGNVKQFDGNISNTTPCNCDPNSESPCGPDSYCINRLLMTECDPEVCPARENCQNQRIEKRQYPPLIPYKTKGRGWGLRTLAPINKGEFVIEYVGEVIDDQEYQRRMAKMHEQKDDNYYFLTIDKDRMIDAGPKGNMARFMNHCCEPNCETQKWTVKGDTRVGLFAKTDIPENSEVTFNYNLESVGEEKKVCRCGAESCSGFIGEKVKNANDEKKMKKLSNKIRKKRSPTPVVPVVNTEPCFLCGKDGDTFPCHNKICTKYYHLKCVKLETKPDGKWSCPWHNCNLCSKRTIRCCVKCINSYCPVHSEGNVRHDKLLGFICTEHDPTKEPQEILTNIIKKPRNPATPTEESDVTSTTHEETEELLDNYSENSSVTKLDDTFEESFEQNESTDKKKRGRRLKKKYPARKRIKLDDSHKNMNILAKNVSPPEIILTSSVPERHLRTNRKVSEDSESERLLKRQRAYEKDLPIRKRTTPRTESTENK